jgi:hypothetical protein
MSSAIIVASRYVIPSLEQTDEVFGTHRQRRRCGRDLTLANPIRCKIAESGSRPRIDAGLRALVRRMSIESRLWGAPRFHGELLKLGFAVA